MRLVPSALDRWGLYKPPGRFKRTKEAARAYHGAGQSYPYLLRQAAGCQPAPSKATPMRTGGPVLRMILAALGQPGIPATTGKS